MKIIPILCRPLALATLLGLTACATVGPEYREPALQLPSTWQAPQSGKLTELKRWWASFRDPALDLLLDAAQKDNPTLARAAAAIERARADRTGVAAGYLPQVAAVGDDGWSGSLKNGTGTSRSRAFGFDAAWEIGAFGKARRSVESAEALEQARSAQWHDARVSLAAEVGATYIDYRACRLKQKYYTEQTRSQSKTTELTALSVEAGFAAPADARLAEASAASTRSTALGQKAECEVLVKSLVALTGLPEPGLRKSLGEEVPPLPRPEGLQVNSLPADLLRQRPDLVSAERTLASTSALIGVAESARYPSLSLSGSVGFSAVSGYSTLAPWSFGPTLAIPLFSAGRIEAGVKGARADFDTALANYRQAVRDAVKEVEQSLVRLEGVAKREEEAVRSAEGYRAYLSASEENWRVGRTSLLDLETARRSAIAADVNLLELKQSRLLYWIALYKAVGGGWKATREGE